MYDDVVKKQDLSPIDNVLSWLDLEFGRLEKTLELLTEKLGSVLGEQRPSESVNEPVRTNYGDSSIAKDLYSKAEHLNRLNTRVDSLIHRVEL